ncbi:hypothetical protein MVLG_06284 [Microbotryum lychnidis-dioicae p1A1 Lamole]|uniref:Ribosomal protein S21 n=1 Tax=Microbotryum lychnidis-dioicae (strain p1A1 Lamole / MvSl-1064) TaxID=683840 RepID=U5HGT1_USTV1|nr:hypothetical protein MVLG_06284 [Microbotryum lychnidis-dioicae p1A1 Lamole]|eukprot:KDE03227.1 hypothetical protein MVLG_06284 [Microbotryum lychnidis-dioicae p1A1 Lamole]
MASLRTAFGALLRPRSSTPIVVASRAFTSFASVRSTSPSEPSTTTRAAAPPASEAKSGSHGASYQSQVLNQATQRLKSHPTPGKSANPNLRGPSFPSTRVPSSSRNRAPASDLYDWSRAMRSTPIPRTLQPEPQQSPEEIWASTNPIGYTLPVTTTAARSIPVKKRDVARACRALNRILNQNNVRKELRRQERFEGPSDKRVRLDSERHRRRFQVEVGKQVGKAMRLRQRI